MLNGALPTCVCVCSYASDEEDAEDAESKLQSETAEDFTDITELAEEDEQTQFSQEPKMLEKESQDDEKERLYQKGVTFLQAASTGQKEAGNWAVYIYFCSDQEL